jgi:hypothetical protein
MTLQLITDPALAAEAENPESPEHINYLVDTQRDRLAQALSDRWWRINNLYWIKAKDTLDAYGNEVEGNVIRFKPNWAQATLYKEMHFRNLVLKARQLGMTTFMCIFEMDWSLFNSGQNCGIIAHKKEDAFSFFQDKILFAYDRLPRILTQSVPTTKREGGWIRFTNDSWIRVSTSMRSATCQILHISEYGKICAERPDKAKEIATGAMQAVPKNGIITVESTAEGATGRFFQMCDTAMKKIRLKKKTTSADYKLFFFPWWKERSYALSDEEAEMVEIPDFLQKYFDEELELERGISLIHNQKAWYVKKLEEIQEDNSALQGSNTGTWDDMRREYPSYAEEAFHTSVVGAYYKIEFARIEKEGQIGNVPHKPGYPVDTWWDIGVGDDTCIWFVQTIKKEVHVIDYYSNSGHGFPHYANVLMEKREKLGYVFGRHIGPHDFAVREFGTGETRIEMARRLGVEFEIAPKLAVDEGISQVRLLLSSCWFDEKKCEVGLGGLRSYHRKFDKSNNRYLDSPAHDAASHPADAFRTGAIVHEFDYYSYRHNMTEIAPPPVAAFS